MKGQELQETHIKNDFEKIAKSMGIFLSELHLIPLSEVKGVENNVSLHYTFDTGYTIYILNKFRKLEDRINKEMYKSCMNFIEKSHPLKFENFSLTHYDFQGKNIIFSPEKSYIIGVIDFSDSVIYDPAIDFSNLFVYGDSFVDEVFKNYNRKDVGILKRAQFFRKKNFVFTLPDSIEKSSGDLKKFEKQYRLLNF